jgi:hypothetical protein
VIEMQEIEVQLTGEGIYNGDGSREDGDLSLTIPSLKALTSHSTCGPASESLLVSERPSGSAAAPFLFSGVLAGDKGRRAGLRLSSPSLLL